MPVLSDRFGSSMSTSTRAVALLGPTAAGKTAAALALAERLPIEIISVDSALVYRGMNIGTAKPSADEQARVPHHLVDIRDPANAYSAAEFVRDASALIADVQARGRTPALVGGTMLYYKALTEGLSTLPPADPTVRAQLDADAAREGWPALHARLAAVDPSAAARLAPNDAQRIQRALEVYLLTGRALTDWWAQTPAHDSPRARADVLCVALEPSDRAVLHARIAERFDAMLAQGFLDEVAALRQRPDLHPDLPAIRAVGYRQAWAYLAGDYGHGSAARERLREAGIAATRQLAKRQLTWLRSLAVDDRVDCLRADAIDGVMDAVLAR